MITSIQGNALHIPLADNSVQCVVTSPPYWGLRDYGTARWEGGDPECDHKPVKDINTAAVNASTLGGGKANQANAELSRSIYREVCAKCGARRVDAQLGLERTPQEYVEHMIAVFREVRRVMRPDAVLWLNLGDSFANKQLVGVPWKVAFALQDDGWFLRMDCIWHKPNPMPESVTDRPTKSHEYLFLLAKSDRYYYDAEAIKEQNSPTSQMGGVYKQDAKYSECGNGHSGLTAQGKVNTWAGRNRRSVWTIATQPYSGAHFAVFPPALVEPCIKAGTSEKGCCPFCGAPHERVVERGASDWEARKADGAPMRAGMNNRGAHGATLSHDLGNRESQTIGWRQTCACPEHEPTPCVVLDPFAGSGTVGRVAAKLNRDCVLIDLSPEYIEMQKQRTDGVQIVLGGF